MCVCVFVQIWRALIEWACALNKVQPMFYYHHLVKFLKCSLVMRSCLARLPFSPWKCQHNSMSWRKSIAKSTYVSWCSFALSLFHSMCLVCLCGDNRYCCFSFCFFYASEIVLCTIIFVVAVYRIRICVSLLKIITTFCMLCVSSHAHPYSFLSSQFRLWHGNFNYRFSCKLWDFCH